MFNLPQISRRSFLASVPLLGAMMGFTPADETAASTSAWDLSWLNELKGKHRQVFGFTDVANRGLDVVTNYLDAHEEVFGLKHPDVNVVIGIASRSYPINASDEMWLKYGIGKRYDIIDPDTREHAVRNIYLHGRPNQLGKTVGVDTLMKRGAIFWQCNNAITSVAMGIARATRQDPATVKAELVANLNPGVKLVPAHTMLIGLCQEHGCSYEAS